MKKLLIGLLATASIIGGSSIVANAASGQWVMDGSGTVIGGSLYNTNGARNSANASTANQSNNGINAYVQLYAYKTNGVIDSDSIRTKSQYGDAGVSSYAASVGIWESLHSTSDSRDQYTSLRLYM